MKNQKLITYSFLHAAGVMLYTSAIAWFLFNGESLFGKEDSFLMPVALLLLLIISATVTGALVLGKPIILYLDGAKKEAIKLLFYTLGWLTVLILIIFLTLFLIK